MVAEANIEGVVRIAVGQFPCNGMIGQFRFRTNKIFELLEASSIDLDDFVLTLASQSLVKVRLESRLVNHLDDLCHAVESDIDRGAGALGGRESSDAGVYTLQIHTF